MLKAPNINNPVSPNNPRKSLGNKTAKNIVKHK